MYTQALIKFPRTSDVLCDRQDNVGMTKGRDGQVELREEGEAAEFFFYLGLCIYFILIYFLCGELGWWSLARNG